MDAISAIFTRRSTRKFTDRPIESEKLHQILDAAMSGPCCVNARDWSFVVVTEKDKLQQMVAANGEPARPLQSAAAGILVCGDLERAFRFAKDTGLWMEQLPPRTSAFAPMRWASARCGSAHGRRWIGYSVRRSFGVCRIP